MLLILNLLAVLATILGGVFPAALGLSSRRGIWRLFALRSGILLAVTFIEILPMAPAREPTLFGWGALAAFGLLFFAGSLSMVDSCPEYLEECPVHILGWSAMAALCAHSFIDGLNFAVSFEAGRRAGLAVGVALVLHKLADGFTLTTLFQQAGYPRARKLCGLAAVAFATPLGSALSWAGLSHLNAGLTAALLGFAGGSFIYIGAVDLLPRLHRAHDRASLAYFGAGLLAIAALQGL